MWGATLLSALARQWGALCTFLSLALLARALSREDFGRFTFYLSVFGFLDVLVDCGTSSAAVQLGARDARVFAGALAAGRRVRLVAALGAALALALAAGIGHERDLAWVCLAALAPLSRAPEMSAVVFQRDIEWGTPLLLRGLGALARLTAIALLSRRAGLGFGPFLVVHTWSLALGNLALHFVARPRLPPRAPPLAGLFARAWPLAALGLVQQAYFWADNGFVRALAGEAELGRYNAAVRVFQLLVFFAAFTTTSALPWLARRSAEGALGDAVTRLAQPLFALGCALAGALVPWCGVLLSRAFGAGFDGAAASLRWLLAALVLVYPGAVFLTALIAAGAMRAALGVALLALLVNLAGNALCVPHFGAEGAAMMTLLTEGTVTFAALFALRARGAWPGRAPLGWCLGPLALVLTTLASLALFAAAFPP